MAATSTRRRDRAEQDGSTAGESVLPEMRAMWWETGMRARTQAGLLAVFAELPRLIWAACGSAGGPTGCAPRWSPWRRSVPA